MSHTNQTARPAPAAPAAASVQTAPLVIAQTTGQVTAAGKQAVTVLGKGHRNGATKRPGFTCRLKRLPASGALIAFNPDHSVFPDGAAAQLRVYAVTGTRAAYSRSRHEWTPYGTATLRADRLGYDITLDAMPPLDSEGDLVFCLLERQIGDVDHADTAIANDVFLKALEQDLSA